MSKIRFIPAQPIRGYQKVTKKISQRIMMLKMRLFLIIFGISTREKRIHHKKVDSQFCDYLNNPKSSKMTFWGLTSGYFSKLSFFILDFTWIGLSKSRVKTVT